MQFREILVLRHLEGLSYKEIADIAQHSAGYGHVAALPRTRRAKGIFGGSDQ